MLKVLGLIIFLTTVFASYDFYKKVKPRAKFIAENSYAPNNRVPTAYRCGDFIDEKMFKTGDVIFQDSQSNQSVTIQKVTHSKWSHVGVVFEYNKDVSLNLNLEEGVYVLEAIHPVTITPLKKWIRRGEECAFALTRLRDDVYQGLLKKFKGKKPQFYKGLYNSFKKYKGLPYDGLFQPEDDAIYCSELVTKMYSQLGVELGEWVPIKTLDLSSQDFQNLKVRRLKPMAQKLGVSVNHLFTKGVNKGKLKIPAIQDKLILTPVSLMEDPKLECLLGCT